VANILVFYSEVPNFKNWSQL